MTEEFASITAAVLDDLRGHYPSLGKWPTLLVEGDPVTPEQAGEIILRKCGWYIASTNDHNFERAVHEALEIRDETVGRDDRMGEFWAVQAFRKRIGALDGEYLSLSSRIASCYVGGPHGWIDWDGTVGTAPAAYSIGKWPEGGEVETEWREIAVAFPFLRVRCQLIPDSYPYGDDDTTPAVEWIIANGEARRVVVGPRIAVRPRPDVAVEMLAALTRGHEGERGVDLGRLRAAYEVAVAAETSRRESADA